MLGVRLDEELEQRLAAVARSQGRSKSDIAREAVRRYVDLHDEAFRREARRQSLRASRREAESDHCFWEAAEVSDALDAERAR
ncbi:ribbon-helix-helix protein, CopG family [uncultured Sphingomonas sp.]|uniref:ribbon-helix-helix protein, CopG family n=1 Tax=uncultured Sphingomonas sp. TaxID=158754 RepID=UPI0025D0DB6F|nr:ribbon-helix-helix protein, CopG family [uncultured Sphingomonas sp.]